MDCNKVPPYFLGSYLNRSYNDKGILLPIPILRAHEKRNSESKRGLYAFPRANGNNYVEVYDRHGLREDKKKKGSILTFSKMRIQLPRGLRDYITFGGRVAVIGCGNHFELWNPDEWLSEEYDEEGMRESFEELDGMSWEA